MRCPIHLKNHFGVLSIAAHPQLSLDDACVCMREEKAIEDALKLGKPITSPEAKYMNKKWLSPLYATEKNVLSKLPLVLARKIMSMVPHKKSSHFNVLETLSGHTDWVMCLALTPDGKIVSGSRDKTVKVWSENTDGKGGWTNETLSAHTDYVYSVGVLPDDTIVSASSDCTIKVWRKKNLNQWELEQSLSTPGKEQVHLAIVQDGRFVSGDMDNMMTVWRKRKEWDVESTILAMFAEVNSIAVLPDARIVSESSNDAETLIEIWRENESGVWVNEATLSHFDSNYEGESRFVESVFVMDGRIVTAGDDERVKVWSEEDGEWVVEATLSGLTGIAMDGPRIAMNRGKMITVWREDSGGWTQEAMFDGYQNDVFCMLGMPDGRIVTSDTYGTINVLG